MVLILGIANKQIQKRLVSFRNILSQKYYFGNEASGKNNVSSSLASGMNPYFK